MLINNDNILFGDSTEQFDFSVISVLGGREEQQDSCGFETEGTDGLFVVCDGIGGHSGGKVASTVTVNEMLSLFGDIRETRNEVDLLLAFSKNTDRRIAALPDENGDPLKAGTTLCSVVIKNRKIRWLSVGDSRIYLYRNGELVKVTRAHNYKYYLDEKLKSGSISDSDYACEIKKGDALISYIGAGGLMLVDINDRLFEAQKDDVILISTDGLFKLVSDDQIKEVIENSEDLTSAASRFEEIAAARAEKLRANRDNMTAIIIKIK